MTTVFPDADIQAGDDTEVKQLPPYHVILLDDDHHTYEYVIEMLMMLMRFTAEKAFQCADKVHKEGRCIVFTGSKEYAELKQEQIHSFGKDYRMSECKGSMTAILEAAR